jgi:NAD(P)-dependent dehydrogenase (short-subunit alcohol dehydrogenase family)
MTRPLSEQVIVIAGASSGIGRETAIRSGKEGASVVTAARNREALEEVAAEIERLGGKALAVPTDVSDWAQLEGLARAAHERFGRIDTWINNAAVSEYATLEAMSPEEIQRIIDVNLVGNIYGCKAAASYMKAQGSGAIINVASALAERAVPLQSVYCASKHGIKGFTEALRLELRRENTDIHVCLVMPSSINTPLFRNARSKVGVKPMPIPPIYEPAVVAEALLELARNPKRDLAVGGSGKTLTLFERVSPGLVDWYMLHGDRMYRQQLTDQPDDGEDNLFAPIPGPGSSTGEFGGKSKSVSLYTRFLELHPQRKALLLWGGLLVWRRLPGAPSGDQCHIASTFGRAETSTISTVAAPSWLRTSMAGAPAPARKASFSITPASCHETSY